VAPFPASEGCGGPAAVVDFPGLRRGGTHALYFEETGAIRIETVAARRGDRPWSAKPPVAPWRSKDERHSPRQ
jgi:hypothetical protein